MSIKSNKFNYNLIVFFIIIINIPAGMAVDQYTPSLPAMVKFFAVNKGVMQWTVSLYLLGLAFSQWICGYYSDYYGRRKMLFPTAIIYLLGVLLCIFAHHFWIILLGRLIQGIGAGVFSMLAPALMGEALDEKDVPRVSGYFTISYSLVPIIAPVIGGYLQHYFNWQANFSFLFVMCFLITIIAFIWLPETRSIETKTSREFGFFKLFKDSFEVICNLNYLRSVICLSLLWSVIPIFGILAPFIIQNLLHQSAKAYGQYALFIGLGFLLGNLLNNILIRKFDHFKIILVSLFLVIVISIVQSIFMFANMLSIVTVMLPSVLIMFFIGIVFPLLFGGAAVAEKRLVGVASALIGCLICLGAFVITFIISLFETHPAVTLSLSFLILSVISLVLQIFNKNS